jgi:hypothetical protein
MKNNDFIVKYTTIVLIVISSLLTTGCSSGYNADLNGKWQLISFQSKGTIQLPVDSIFYNFENHIFVVQNLSSFSNQAKAELFGEFFQTSDSLIFKVVDSGYPLGNFFWTGNERKFKIDRISSSVLWLSDSIGSYHFRSYP